MRIAVVLSDISFPPREGLHQQSQLLIRELSTLGEVTVYVLTRDSEVTSDVLTRELGVQVGMEPILYHGPSAWFALWNGRFRGKPIARLLQASSADVIILDGVVAGGAVGPWLQGVPHVLNWVDPGSRRYARFASRHGSRSSRWLRFRLIGALHRVLECRASRTGGPWIFVSYEDASYMRARYRHADVQCIPIILEEATQPISAIRARPNGEGRRRVEILVYVDGRVDHGREALLGCLAEMVAAPNENRLQVTVMARVKEDKELAKASGKLAVKFLPWVDDPLAELQRADIVVIPDLVGTGVKNRTVQAITHSARVLATPSGLEGIMLPPDVRAQIEYSPGSLARALEEALATPPDDLCFRQRQLRRAAQQFSPEHVRNQWKRVIDASLDSAQRSRTP